MKKRIILADYYGVCDENGKAIGHSPKVIKEYSDLLKENYSVSAAVSPCIAAEIDIADYEDIYNLRYDVVEANYKKVSKRIFDKYKIFYNIYQVFKYGKEKNIFFYRVDFFFMLYLLLMRRSKNKKIALVYQLGFGKGIVERLTTQLYRQSLKKLDGVIYTQKGMNIQSVNCFYMPDYLYFEEKYKKYKQSVKKEKVICLGAMNPYKKLEELVSVFNELGYQLEIIGYFFDKSRFNELCKKANKNITIIDSILDEEEYYAKMSEAKYAIMPYDMRQYTNRTSGVLIESAFLDTVPIAPEELLNNNGISGVGYDELRDLKNFTWQNNTEKYLCSNREIVKKYYDEKKVRTELIQWIENI